MTLHREITANQKRLNRLIQISFCRLRKRIALSFGQVDTHALDRVQPEIGHEQIEDEQNTQAKPLAVVLLPTVARPADPLQTQQIEHEEDPNDRNIVINVPNIEDAPLDGLKTRPAADLLENAADAVVKQCCQ